MCVLFSGYTYSTNKIALNFLHVAPWRHRIPPPPTVHCFMRFSRLSTGFVKNLNYLDYVLYGEKTKISNFQTLPSSDFRIAIRFRCFIGAFSKLNATTPSETWRNKTCREQSNNNINSFPSFYKFVLKTGSSALDIIEIIKSVCCHRLYIILICSAFFVECT